MARNSGRYILTWMNCATVLCWSGGGALSDASERGLGMSLLKGTTDEDVKKSTKPIVNYVKRILLKVVVANIDESVASFVGIKSERTYMVNMDDVAGMTYERFGR